MINVTVLKIEQFGVLIADVILFEYANVMQNSADSDQTAPRSSLIRDCTVYS